MVAAGGVGWKSGIRISVACMIQDPTPDASCGFRNLGARVIPMKFNNNVKRVLFGAEFFPFQ